MAKSLRDVAVNVRFYNPREGHVVSLNVGGAIVLLEPAEAHEVARRLMDQATEAMHADRADRRG